MSQEYKTCPACNAQTEEYGRLALVCLPHCPYLDFGLGSVCDHCCVKAQEHLAKTLEYAAILDAKATREALSYDRSSDRVSASEFIPVYARMLQQEMTAMFNLRREMDKWVAGQAQ